MVFRSQVKEALYQELRAFIIRFQSRCVHNTVEPIEIKSSLTRQIFVHLIVTKDNAVLVHLVDKEGNPLFKLEFYFGTVDSLGYVGIKYSDVDGLGSMTSFYLTDKEGIDNFLIQTIKFIPSDSYVKHYVTVFKNQVRNWLV